MAVKFLKKFHDKNSGKGLSLKYQLHKKMAKWESARSHKFVHASDLTKSDFCPKEFALLDQTGKKPKGQFIGTSLRATFDLGYSLQDMLNQSWGVEWCIGTWVCEYCTNHYSFQKRPKQCDCGHNRFRYKEEVFSSPGAGYNGSIDYIYDPGQQPYRIVEVKTIKPDAFKELVAPLAEHKARTELYLSLISEDTQTYRKSRINLDEASVLYICKGYGCSDKTLKELGIGDMPFSPFKEFPIKRNDDGVQVYIDKAKAVHHFRNGGPMPERICPTSMCKRAKNCPVQKECWGSK